MAEEKKSNKKVDELVEEISKLSVLDLSELVKALQDKLGVSASMPVATVTAAASGEQTQPTEAQSGSTAGTNQTLIMANAGENKIAVIKALREINQNLTLMDAKAMTETVPAEVLKDAKAEDVKTAADKLKAAGAQVELR